MRRLLAAVGAALIIAGSIVPAFGAAPSAAAASAVPKVVLVVGPSGAATDRYRSEARKAAALARAYTPDVTEIYSPNATWPAVKAALQGASVVIYMGHGNGWPSKYRDELYPPTQNGFGLNPKADGDDYTHQYFGEERIAADVKLADDAVVLLNHLCYASGNSEPGLAEGTLDEARQRVDNFAAGFIAAGASAVVAEAYASPNHMLKAILEGKRSIERSWRTAPTRNGNVFGFESARSPGFVAQMDPERASSGFTRSVVLKAGLASADVLRGAMGSPRAGRIPAIAQAPSLVRAGMSLQQPTLVRTNAASSVGLRVRYKITDRDTLPKAILASVRWDALDPATTDPGPDVTAPPDLGLVTPERPGDVVAPVKVHLGKTSFSLKVATPATPGRYRLSITLHDRDGVAYDAATQALLTPLIVRVTGELDAAIVGAAATQLAPGAAATLPLWVANLGVGAWGHGPIENAKDPDGSAPAAAARVTGQWVALGVDDPAQVAAAAAASVTAAVLPAGLLPRVMVPADLQLFAPTVAGEYLLVLDVVTPERGSVVAAGVEATIIRVHVAESETVAPAPVGTPPAEPSTSAAAGDPGASGEPASSDDATPGDATAPGGTARGPLTTPAPAPTSPAQ